MVALLWDYTKYSLLYWYTIRVNFMVCESYLSKTVTKIKRRSRGKNWHLPFYQVSSIFEENEAYNLHYTEVSMSVKNLSCRRLTSKGGSFHYLKNPMISWLCQLNELDCIRIPTSGYWQHLWAHHSGETALSAHLNSWVMTHRASALSLFSELLRVYRKH